ncbi:type I restriction enzyme S subunit [Runella defluvii]|uniref:Type I restriction enzyme S subunit n=1 Tax=Runella defluvii TaxID=370973 RepID=A0A7W5ZJA0_9BACT|nr:restriction endonuclease subunit S [Runella defluvii]MBB3838175.1 type I restriction enzyme S subunit [Runella defluvii]
MKLTRIGDIAEFINGYAFKSEHWGSTGKKIIRIQNLTDPSKPYNFTAYDIPEKYIVKDGDMLVSWSATIDIFEWHNEPAYLNQHIFKVVFDHKKVDKYYFRFALKQTIDSLTKFAQGSTMKHIVKGDFEKHKIPLPDLVEQQKIAYILSKAEALIQKRKDTINGLDELLKYTFLDMFGDPVKNPKGWEKGGMVEVITSIKSGTSYAGAENKELEQNELGVLKISAVTDGVFKPKEFKAVSIDLITKQIIKCQKGMFLMSRANTKELVAACCIVPKDYPFLFLPDKLWSLSVNEQRANKIFLNALFKIESFRNVIREKASGGHESMLNISMMKFLGLKLPIPPLLFQTQFAETVAKIEALKAKQEASLRELEQLYQSLMQRAFKGELDLDKVEIEDVYKGFEYFDGGFVTFDDAKPALDKIREKFETLPAIKSKDKKLIEKIKKLDLDKVQLGRIPFDKDYAIYRVLYHRFEHYQSVPFLTIYDWLLTDFVDLDYNKIKDFVFRELNEEAPIFEQIFIFNEDEKKYRTELKLLL